MTYLLAFLGSFVYVAFKASQQVSVVTQRWSWVPVGSYGMAACEILIVSSIASHAENMLLLWFCLGTGGWMGCYLSMFIDRRMNHGR